MSTLALPRTSELEAFYGDLLTAGFFTCEEAEPYFPERLLQIVWNEQLLKRPLQTADGRGLEVVHPGAWNVEAGPDFRDAVVFLDGESRRGHVEAHLRPEDWEAHRHTGNPAYADTVLHVVWANPRQHRTFPAATPLFVVRDFLALPVAELIDRCAAGAYPYARQVPPGEWAARFAVQEDPALRGLLESHGLSRILRKARDAGELVERVGLEEAAYRLFCDAMGYKDNRKAFGLLAAALPLRALQATDPLTVQALLFGAAGLLPDPTRAAILPAHRQRVQELWRRWGSRRDGFQVLPWSRRQRPYNAPERRLLAVQLMLQQSGGRLGSSIVTAMLEAPDGGAARQRLEALFTLPDEPWRGFYDFPRELDPPAALVGPDRRTDLLANLAVPLFLAWCFLNRRPDLCHRAKQVFRSLPKLQDNRLLQEAVHFFFVPPSRARVLLTNACAQQGLLQLYHDVCSSLATPAAGPCRD